MSVSSISLLHYMSILHLAVTTIAIPLGSEVPSLSKRDYVPFCTPYSYGSSSVVGDGFPHQNFIWKQVSDAVDCRNHPGNGISVTQSHTVEWSANIGLELGLDKYIKGGVLSAGFDITESFSTEKTNTFSCETNEGKGLDGSLCVFQRVQVTAYTADLTTCHDKRGSTFCIHAPQCDTKRAIVFAPNKRQATCFQTSDQIKAPCKDVGQEISVHVVPFGGDGAPLDCDFGPSFPA